MFDRVWRDKLMPRVSYTDIAVQNSFTAVKRQLWGIQPVDTVRFLVVWAIDASVYRLRDIL